MDFPRPSKSAGDIFNSLKEKISLQSRKNETDDYYEDEVIDDFDDVMVSGSNNYGPYGYDAPYEEEYHYTSRSSSNRNSYHSPRLVTSEAARASVDSLGLGASSLSSVTDASNQTQPIKPVVHGPRFSFLDSAEEHQSNEGIEGYDRPATSYGEFVSPYKENRTQSATSSSTASTSNSAVSADYSQPKQTGLDKLFTPTVPAAQANAAEASFTAAESSVPVRRSTTRNVVMVKPVTYEDVEGIASAVKAGEIVALVLRITNDALSKRILDFSFGVASALDARVECIADKVFVITRGNDLTLEEKHELRKQGVI